MPTIDRQLVGREEELEAIVRLLDDRAELPATAILHGAAGIGKTSLALAGIDAARIRGFLVMSCRPVEAETRFSYAGVTDLLGRTVDDVLPRLPPVQQRALEAALLIGEAELRPDDRAVAAAFLEAIRLLADDGPVCLAVDDLQWLDAASLGTLRYALARVDREPVAALLAVRGEPPEWLRRASPEAAPRTIHLRGLSVGELRELLRVRLDVAFPRPTLLRLWETSGGNPFFALELASALQRRGGALSPGEALPIPGALDELLQARLDGLGPAALAVARVVAALADPTVALVESAVGDQADAGLAEALAARLLELGSGRVRFTHPLLGSAVTARETPRHRRALHAQLARLASTAEERARHLALATSAPSSAVAATLEEAARSAQSRGAPVAAAELAEQALRLTPSANGADARRRRFLAADRYHIAGDLDRGRALLDEAREATASSQEHAAVLAQLARLTPSPPEAIGLYREALAAGEGDDALQAEIHLNLAGLMRYDEGVERGLEHGELAVRAASRTGDAALRCRALAAYGLLHFNAGRGIPHVEMDEALTLERSLPDWPLDAGPAGVLGHQLWWSGDVDPARSLLHEFRAAVRARGDLLAEADAMWYLGFVEWRAGNWEHAERYATDSLELTTQLGHVLPGTGFPSAVIDAHRGRLEEARDRAQRALVRADAEGIGVVQAGFGWVLGFIELSRADHSAALPILRNAHAHRADVPHDPGMRLHLGDLLEALVATGALDEADAVLTSEEVNARALDRAWALAIIGRGRGLLLAAQGDLEGAFASFAQAVDDHARSIDPFHHARTLLALGKTERRAKRRGAARATLEDALARFETLGAPLWAEQTRAEIARIGGRAPSRGELTEAERRIAGLVAEGQTNREVAAALFLTEHSVETALTRVYRKLGVRSRSELARILAAKS